MAKTWKEIRAKNSKLSPARRAKVDEEVAREVLEMSLSDLRQECGFTQAQIADALEMAQGAVSRMEHRDDHLVSTLRKVVEALGGELEVTARFRKKLIRIA